MANYNIGYTEPENPLDNAHNVAGEDLADIVFSGKGAVNIARRKRMERGMGEITAQELWALLSDRERMVIRATKEGRYIPGLEDVYAGLTAKDYIRPVKASMTLRPGKDYQLTADGESLLPVVEVVTWESLTEEEQNAVLLFREHNCVGFPTDEATSRAHNGLIEKGVIVRNSDVGYVFTPAGQALLPKAAAQTGEPCTYCDGSGYITRQFIRGDERTNRCPKCNPLPMSERYEPADDATVEKTSLRADLEAIAHEATGDYTPAGIATWSLTKLDTLEQQRDAALARAEAAEAEVARLRDGLKPFAEVWADYQELQELTDYQKTFGEFAMQRWDFQNVAIVYEKAAKALDE